MSDYVELDLSISNPIFKALQSVPPKDGRKSVYLPNKVLPPELFYALSEIYHHLSDEKDTLNEDDVTVAVGFREWNEELTPNRTYTPCIHRDGDQLVLRWSRNYLPICYDEDSKQFSCGLSPLELQEQKIGNFQEIVLTGYFDIVVVPEEFESVEDMDEDAVEENTKTYIMHFPVRPKDYKQRLNLSVMKGLLTKKKLGSFLDMIQDKPESKSSDGLGRATTDVRKLDPGEYTVLQATPRKTSYGDTYVLLLQKDEEAGLYEDTTAWSYSTINGLLDAGLELPATYEYKRSQTEDGKNRHKFIFQNPKFKGDKGGLNLTWLK